MEKACSQERKARRQCQADNEELKSRIETLEKAETQLRKWESRKATINHYMSQVGAMAE